MSESERPNEPEDQTPAADDAPGDSPGFDLSYGLNKRGAEHFTANELEQAEGCFRQALALSPDNLAATLNLANLLHATRRVPEAGELFVRALGMNPDLPQPYNALGDMAFRAGRPDKAAPLFKRAIELRPGYAEALSNFIFVLQYLPDVPDGDILRVATEFGRMLEKEPPVDTHDNPPILDRPLNIGYLSPDFRFHPRWAFFRGVLTGHDPSRFRVFCYHDSGTQDSFTRDLAGAGGEWRVVAGMNHEALERRIRADGIDILVEMTGHQGRNRLPLMARRPAPVQVRWMGHAGTSGLRCIDYFLAGELELPPGSKKFYTERLVRLPGGHSCWTPPGYAPAVGPLPALSQGGFTFGSFNNLVKIGRGEAGLWSRILNETPGSRLMVKAPSLSSRESREHAASLFREHGVGPDRLVFEGATSHAQHLAAMNRVDLALDPLSYSGNTSTCEALFMGVPVLTRPGRMHHTRHSLSLLILAGLGGWVARDRDEYVAKAVAASRDLERLAALRKGLRKRLLDSAVCDNVAFVRHLEAVYRMMWTNWVRSRFSPFPAFG